MNRIIEQQIQRLGQLRLQRQQLETQEQELVRSVRGQMVEHGVNTVCSDEFEAKIITQERLTVKPVAFHRAVTKKEFMEAATISVTAAREILGDRKLRKISSVAETVQLRITARRRSPAATPQNTASCGATV
jgi:hypothetical protein